MMRPLIRAEEAFAGVVPRPHENLPVAPSIKRLVLAALAKRCERCGAVQGVQREPCRTSYADPKENVSPWLCRPCAEEYHDQWDEMWADYYSGSGVAYVTAAQLKAQRN